MTIRVRVRLPNAPLVVTQNHYPVLCLLQSSYNKTLSVKVAQNYNLKKILQTDFLIFVPLLRYDLEANHISAMKANKNIPPATFFRNGSLDHFVSDT